MKLQKQLNNIYKKMASSRLIWNLMPFHWVSVLFTTYNWILCERQIDFTASERPEGTIWGTVSNWKSYFSPLVNWVWDVFEFLDQEEYLSTWKKKSNLNFVSEGEDTLPSSWPISNLRHLSRTASLCIQSILSVCLLPCFQSDMNQSLFCISSPPPQNSLFLFFSCNWS